MSIQTTKSQIKTAIKYRLFGPPGPRMRTIHHGLLKGLNCTVDTSHQTLHITGMYEREIASVLRDYSAKATTAFDIGSNDGWYALYFASVKNIQKVYAFEPEERLLKLLGQNLDANKPEIGSKIVTIPKKVGATTDDSWCTIDSLGLDTGSNPILKIDVEGGELNVLQGARQTLTSTNAMLVVETHSAELERNCIAFLNKLGYQSTIIQPAWYRLFAPHDRPSEFNQWFAAQRPK